MIIFKKIVLYYFIFNISNILLIWSEKWFAIDSVFVLSAFFYLGFVAPINTFFISLVHFLRINTKILNNIWSMTIVSLFPALFTGLWLTIAYNLTDTYFISGFDEKVICKKWYLDFAYVYVISYFVLLALLAFHGKKQGRSRIL